MKNVDKEQFFDFIKSTFIKDISKGNIIFNKKVGDCEVDLYLPRKKVVIKLRGYNWDKVGYKLPRQDTKYFMDMGIRLINIYDYEWYNFEENFKTFIYDLIYSRNKHLIRSNVVVEISRDNFIDFLKKYHLFSNTIQSCSVMYGIYEGNELVAVSGFNKKNRKYNWEWKRFCIKQGWMNSEENNVVKLFLDKFSENHKGLLVDLQQVDRFPFSSNLGLGFARKGWNTGVVSINTETMNFTRHGFIPEKPLNKEETMLKYGFNKEFPNSGTITWVKEIE